MNKMKLSLVVILFTIINLFFISSVFPINQTNQIHSIWECSAGEYDKMLFKLYTDSTFIYIFFGTKKRYKGKWEYYKNNSQLLFTFNQNISYWNKRLFDDNKYSFIKYKINDGSIGYYNKKERKVGFIIQKHYNKPFIDFLGFNFYKI